MTLFQRLCVGACALATAASLAATAVAQPAKALSDADARAYAAAFKAIDDGDVLGAQLQTTEIQDQSLAGYVSFGALMHPSAHTPSFDELCGWLTRFRSLPIADRVFSLASKRKPADAAVDPPRPEVALTTNPRSEVTRPAREAFYAGDAHTAFKLAVEVGERWIAGLAAWRLQDYVQARDYFAQVARDDQEDPWLRSAAAYWASRSAMALGDGAGARSFLKMAAMAPQTFYGMIAERQTQKTLAEAAPTGQLTLAAYHEAEPDLTQFVQQDPRAHRAAALAQIGRQEEAREELRAGLALSHTSAERKAWNDLLTALGPAAGPGFSRPQYLTLGAYQTPNLEPRNGFTVDRALVYAIVRQESAFNPGAVSPAGAMGLMQMLPSSATLATGDSRYRRRPKVLLNPQVNLRVGQDYIAYLMDRGVGPDILKVVAAYNAGPGAVLKTTSMIGDDDPLLMIECLPALETRNYVEKVMAAYWTYRRMFGEETRTLDALAGGAKRIDLHLDLPDPGRQQAQAAPQALGVIDAILDKTALD